MLKRIELFVVILLLSGMGYTKETMKWPAPTQQIIEIDRRAGRWYMSETGKAVYLLRAGCEGWRLARRLTLLRYRLQG